MQISPWSLTSPNHGVLLVYSSSDNKYFLSLISGPCHQVLKESRFSNPGGTSNQRSAFGFLRKPLSDQVMDLHILLPNECVLGKSRRCLSQVTISIGRPRGLKAIQGG